MNKRRITTASVALMLIAVTMLPGVVLAQAVVSSELDASIRLGLGLDSEPDTDLSFRNFASRVRWSASADVDETTRLVSYVELGFDQDNGVTTTRHAWVGVTGNPGTLTGGKQYSAFYDAVSSKVDIAYWASCLIEIGCNRQSSIVKYASNSTDNAVQWLASVTLDDGNDEVVDGFDIGARQTRGEIEYGVGASFLGKRSFQTADGLDVVEVDSGFALGISAAKEMAGGLVSGTLQLASDDYAASDDSVSQLTAAYAKGQIYGLLGVRNADDTGYFLTGGYIKPLIDDQALAYFEAGLIDSGVDGSDTNFQARGVLVFNFGKISASSTPLLQ